MKERRALFAEAVAAAFLAGRWRAPEMAKRASDVTTNVPESLLGPLAKRVHASFKEEPPHDAFDDLALRILRDEAVAAIAIENWDRISAKFVERPAVVRMRSAAHEQWRLPRFDNTKDVANWLGLSLGDLGWFSDRRGLSRLRDRDAKLQHYTYRWLNKKSGGRRLVEAPKRWLKDLQRRILHEILDRVPAHDAAHGFRRGRSIVTNASAHAGREVVLRLDLQDFFVSVRAPRVMRVFRGLGYPQEVARILTGLCTTKSPSFAIDPGVRSSLPTHHEVQEHREMLCRYQQRHLPQGAPTSPALANLSAYGLDARLHGAATKLLPGAIYTRYADDLTFSGKSEPLARAHTFASFVTFVSTIAHDEGFRINHRKTRLMRASVSQRVTGLIVNSANANVSRIEIDRIKAILHNVLQHGPSTQLARSGQLTIEALRVHLEGKVAWIAHVQPDRPKTLRLQSELTQIDWSR
jgi:RNA-directed DNA polymerase